jgi:hypothetical protein
MPMHHEEPTKNRAFLPYRWELVALLWFAYFFNQADRQVYNVVLASLSLVYLGSAAVLLVATQTSLARDRYVEHDA